MRSLDGIKEQNKFGVRKEVDSLLESAVGKLHAAKLIVDLNPDVWEGELSASDVERALDQARACLG